MSVKLINIKRKNDSEPVCYHCGSFNIDLLNKQDNKRVFKCRDCGKVWIKREGYGKKEK